MYRSDIISGFLFSVMLLPAGQVSAESWSYKLAPYVLAPNIDGNARVGTLIDAGVSVDPIDIINTLDLGGMLFGEALSPSGWGAVLDYSFMELSDSGTFEDGAGTIRSEVFQGVLTASIFKRLTDSADYTIDLYGGIRWWDMDLEVDATLGPISPSVDVSESWVDPHIGLRARRRIGDTAWTMFGVADVGGFGVSSEFAWTLQGGFAWMASDRFSLEFSYKALGVDYETGTTGQSNLFGYDTITHGFLVGFVWDF